jgi:4-hydroxy-2-oxoheptanedioate aldolase
MGIEDARKVVQMTRFHPIGRRPLDGGNADGAYAMMDYVDYIKQANDQRFIILQIEDPEPLDDLEAIAALDGIDMLFFGPADFSQGIGAPGNWNHPKLLETRKRVAEIAIKYGKYAGIPANLDNVDELIAMGYKFLNMGADVIMVGKYCKQLMDGFIKKVKVNG